MDEKEMKATLATITMFTGITSMAGRPWYEMKIVRLISALRAERLALEKETKAAEKLAEKVDCGPCPYGDECNTSEMNDEECVVLILKWAREEK